MRFKMLFLKCLLIYTIISCKEEEKNPTLNWEDLNNINIQFITGDEVRILSIMSIIKQGDSIEAIIKQPYNNYGFLADSIWNTKLNITDLKFLNKFLKMVSQQPDTCSLLSTSLDRYRITINNDSVIRIFGNCEWDNVDYMELEKQFFAKQRQLLEIKRKHVKDSIRNVFFGTWDVTGWKDGKLVNKNVILQRTTGVSPNKPGYYRWSFDPNNISAKIKRLNVDGKTPTITIRGSVYEIIEIDSNNINLRYLW